FAGICGFCVIFCPLLSLCRHGLSEVLEQKYWNKFNISCYYVSNVRKNWTMSRLDCIARGADLVIIDSREEQVFVQSLLNSSQDAWIGMTDSVEEGTWMWVDGSPVTITFWRPGQPNSYQGDQDCGEVLQTEGGHWNDYSCSTEQIWICEKKHKPQN
uniref:C-type lectin domain-containing protein n=1 Tax=Mola mola TaxID=94237 RepID=A0A3Q4AGM8_MOLML